MAIDNFTKLASKSKTCGVTNCNKMLNSISIVAQIIILNIEELIIINNYYVF